MGKSKSKKQQAAVDEPGPDDFTYLAVFFPIGRNGAAMARDSDPEDIAAAVRIGTWLHYAGLPIRKLFSRKSEEHVLVEVREEVPQAVIDSKLGAYRWADMLYTVLAKDADSESIVMRARVKSHDAIEKMGGMVYFPIPKIVPDGPRSQSRFKDPFPQPRRHSMTEPSKFSAIKYLPLPPPPAFTEEDIKPRLHDNFEDTEPDIKPDIKPSIKPDIKPDVKSQFSQDVKPQDVKDELGDIKPNYDPTLDPDVKPFVKHEEEDKKFIKSEAIPHDIVPNYDPTQDPDDFKPLAETNNQLRGYSVKPEHIPHDLIPNYDPTLEGDIKPDIAPGYSNSAHPPIDANNAEAESGLSSTDPASPTA
ncbi:hypothetical protein RhiJN_26443 [Ceratobasidium sp. AG-Ba]|nr:hypothetical protein RhiJN_26443 [Ceratobasidium sp. AG-Ba]